MLVPSYEELQAFSSISTVTAIKKKTKWEKKGKPQEHSEKM